MKFFVYILYNKKYDKFYIGQTDNLRRRIFEHQNRLSVYTSKYNGGWHLVYQEKYDTRSEAMIQEKFLKNQKSKKFYKKLCGSKAAG
ncbi:MAG: GIY-YIG nuclease family protein [Candidatus Falkowbacteria bacterium]